MATFASDDEEAQHWLRLLKDGSRYQKFEARWSLAQIFERRGMSDEAVELLETNVAAGYRTPEVFEQLARLYRSQGKTVKYLEAHAETERLRASRVRLTKDLAAERRAETADVSWGIILLAVGLVVTVGTFLSAMDGGGSFVILYGAIIVGGYLLFRSSR